MFVGETGVGRTIQATYRCDEQGRDHRSNMTSRKIRDLGVIDLPTIQKKAEPALYPCP